MTAGKKREDLQLELARILTSPEARIRAPKRIFDNDPSSWRDLECKVRQIFTECGCDAASQKSVKTARDRVNVDVVVQDKTRRPHQLIFCECKHWKRKVPKTVVHAFRTVVTDAGANLGYIISDRGFQPGSRQAATKANIRLVTWKQFQAELFERWFEIMEQRLTDACNAIYALKETTDGSSGHRTLADRAVEDGGDNALNLFEALQRKYVQLSFASTAIGAGRFRRFPFRGLDPTAVSEDRRIIEFKSPRMYFDKMFQAAPAAFNDYANFLMRYAGGVRGTHQLFDSLIVRKIRPQKSTMDDVRKLLGWGAGVRVTPQGETWTYNGSMTQLRLAERDEPGALTGSARTHVRTLTVEFSRDGTVRRTEKKHYVRNGT